MKRQEIFDAVLTHIRAQKKRAYDSVMGTCCYRGEGGTSCAIGCLLTDEEYAPNLEGKSACELALHGRLPGRLRPKQNALFLEALQSAHDDFLEYGLLEWEAEMSVLATQYNLEYKGPNNDG